MAKTNKVPDRREDIQKTWPFLIISFFMGILFLLPLYLFIMYLFK